MLKNLFQNSWLKKTVYTISAGMLSLAITHSVYAAPAQNPLFLTAPVTPIMMLNMSNDHQLFFKAYDDYSDLDGDGTPDTTYKNTYEYYGYFDSDKCYVYSTTDNRFNPSSFAVVSGADGKYCNNGVQNEWSGNFLNWATMTRMDAVRKILYGGKRASASDTTALTVLERAFLPNDAHAFAKYYAGSDADRLTPFASNIGASNVQERGITICNTTDPTDRNVYSQNVTDPPLLRVARGNYSLWASNERWQCRWGANVGNNSGGSGYNENVPASSGINAASYSPYKTTSGSNTGVALGQGDYNVRVRVCVPGFINAANNENCRNYTNATSVVTAKPSGLLQEFGEDNSIHFGLLTGSYSLNKSGGVLRKNIGSMVGEIDLTTGIFVQPTGENVSTFNGIIRTLDLLRIYGYNYDVASDQQGAYNNATADNCPYGWNSFVNGQCSNWGNPQSEIFLESLRYLSGQSASFAADDSARIAGLNQASWSKPVSNDNYCAPLSVIQFNASTSSYDANELSGVTNIGLGSVAALSAITDSVGTYEGITGTARFVGQIKPAAVPPAVPDNDNNQLCTAKTIGSLSTVGGTCPDAPRLEGSYQIAGLAHHARKTGIPLNGVIRGPGSQTVRTYGVALAPAVPKVEVPLPGNAAHKITILPACRNSSISGNCAIVDFKIVEQEFNVPDDSGVLSNTGKLYVNWEDSEQGGDFDQDMWGVIDYKITNSSASVTTRVVAQSTPNKMGFGYVIGGTLNDGFKVHSGIKDFIFGTSCTAVDGNRCTCRSDTGHGVCDSVQAAARTQSYNITSGSISSLALEQPLYYASKWGGYSKAFVDTLKAEAGNGYNDTYLIDNIKERSVDDSYFFATDPRRLEQSLRSAFQSVAEGIGSASAVSTSSTRLTEGSLVYQALFDSKDWSGELKILTLNSNGEVVESNPKISTDNANTFTSRNIVTYNPDSTAANKLVSFEWTNLSDQQKLALIQDDDESVGQKRLAWLRGERTNESIAGGMRVRQKLLGDIVNSSPVYSGNKNARYLQLPGDAGASYATYTKDKVVYVGANDGMLHAFDATTLNEIFAFVPTGVYPKLANITKPDYGMGANPHQYLVDGSLTVADYYTGSAWKTVVVGTLGAGGQGVFALDVTNPNAPRILFERGAADGVGYILGQPTVAQMINGNWAVVFENGYENGTSKLFVIDLNNPNGANSKVIDTGGGTGLSAVALLPNALGRVEYAYAGDLLGNLWKFNLSSTSPADWDSERIFIAQYTSGGQTYPQPITGAPTLGRNSLKNNATMIYFGTGKYFETSDNGSPALPRQSFYALADTGSVITKASLHKKTIVQAAGATKRTINGERNTDSNGLVTSAVDWTTKQGWYLDFDAVNGERVITKPLLAFDRLIFTTLIPSSVPCSFGGSSWLMELVAVGDRNIAHSILGDDLANTELDNAVLGELSVGVGSDKLKLIPCDISGDCDLLEGELEQGDRGRMSWRQLR